MKIGFIGAVPPASVFPEDCILPRYRKPTHPAPWIGGLLPELARLADFELRVFVVHRAVAKPCVVERGGVQYEGVPSPMLERFAPHTFFHSKSFVVSGAIRRFRPDLIHAFGLENGFGTIALRHGVPVSCFLQGIAERYLPYYGQRSFINKRVAVACERAAVKQVRWMIAETEFARDWALGHNPDARVEVIPHPLRPVFLGAESTPDAKRIISVGGLDHRKGMDTIIRAFARVGDPEARLCIVGGGPSEGELRALAAELKVEGQTEFAGVADTEQVLEELSKSSIFVIASRMDTSPNVLTEAHAVGLPVIGTKVGGIPEMIDEGVDGFQVEMDGVEEMAERMRCLLEDPNKARTMGAHGKEKVRVLNDPARVAGVQAQFFQRIREDLGK